MPDGFVRKAQFFLRQRTAALRMLPGFLIIGAQKSGTTTLYNYLNQHPAVGRSFTQEVHYFDLNFQRGLGWYRAHFPTVFHQRLTKLQSGIEPLTGEASAYYLFHPHVCWRVRQTLPEVRLIIVLRDPTERAWAHYLHNRRAFEPLSFEDAIGQEEERLRGESLRLLRDESATSFTYREYSYLSRGVYVDQIRAWTSIFPREQIHIVCSEDLLFKDPAAAVDGVQNFLDLPPRRPNRLQTYDRERKLAAMNEATQRQLREHFRPHNQRLFDFLGVDFGWDR
jgi:hypothetical protein